MTNPRFLVVNGARDSWAIPSSGRVISLGYQGLHFPMFKLVLETFRPVALLDLRESASFRDRGFSVERAFQVFSTERMEYGRINEGLGSMQQVPAGLLASMWSWLARGPVVLLGAARGYQGSERERLVQWLARERALQVLLHDRDSHQRWHSLEFFETTRQSCEERLPSPTKDQLQLPLPLGHAFEPTRKARRRGTQGPPSGT